MWPFSNKKEEDKDPVLQNHKRETASSYSEDEESVHDELTRQYPSPESAIEDVRKGYVTEEQLQKCFTQDEIDYIKKECKERDAEDSIIPTSF
jgi:hypothetical protein